MESAGTKKEKAALNNLRKFEQAGQIMETENGKAAVSPCTWCTRKGLEVPCRVFKDRDDKTCAYCKRMGKSGCQAALPKEKSRGDELQLQVDKLEEEIKSSQNLIEILEEEVAELKMRVDEIARRLYWDV